MAANVPDSTVANDSVIALLRRSVLFSVDFGRFGNTRKVSSSLVEVDADKSMIAIQKQLLDSRELKAIASFDSEIRQYLYSRSVPSPLKGGIYLLPLALVSEVDAWCTARVPMREILIDAFVAAYVGQIQDSRTRLRSAFDVRNYPAVETVRKSFVFTWQYLSLSAPETLPADMFQREQEKIAAQFAEAWDETRTLLRVALGELVDHASERLSGKSDGKAKIFRDSLVANLNDFISTFDARNLTDDAALADLVGRARGLLSGVNPQLLRTDDAARNRIAAGMADIRANLDGMMDDKPVRLFRSIPGDAA